MKSQITEINGQPLNPEQVSYLGGFLEGLSHKGLKFDELEADPVKHLSTSEPEPDIASMIAEEQIKKSEHPLDVFSRIRENARTNMAPVKEDIFRFKWHGLFYISPDHEGFMCRLRIPGGMVTSPQLRELSSISSELTSGYIQITTRNNFQLRQILPADAPELLRRIQAIGLHSQGAGADNIRNITASPTAGIDPYEIIDVTPYCQDLAQCIISQRRFYDLPRKFNVCFDGGGLVGVVEDTNDIGLKAVLIQDDNPYQIQGGVYFRVLLGGVTGHKKFAEDAFIVVSPDQAVDFICALIQVYIEDGNRTNRKKNRMVYLLEKIGFDAFVEKAEEVCGIKATRIQVDDSKNIVGAIDRPLPSVSHSHVGVFPQKQDDLFYVGADVAVGQMTPGDLSSLAELADEFGTGEIRLTVWQNFIIPNVHQSRTAELERKLNDLGFATLPDMIKSGVVACTGNAHCNFASSDTKSHGIQLGEYLQQEVSLDQPVNIHITGCPHSCAQHYIGDVGLLACKVKTPSGDKVEGYHIFLGGGFGKNKKVGRPIFKSIPFDEVRTLLKNLLLSYKSGGQSGESFIEFTSRHSDEQLVEMGNSQVGVS